MEIVEYIKSSEDLLAEFNASLPDQINILAYGNHLVPSKIYSFRETLLHRVTDLSDTAIQLAKTNQIVSSIILGRAILETAAAVYLLSIKSQRFLDGTITINQLNEYLMKSMFGSKEDNTKFDRFNIQNTIDTVVKDHPKFGVLYNRTCEIVHPSWPGVQGNYSHLDTTNQILYLGKDKSSLGEIDVWQPIAMGMTLFKESYNDCLPIIQAVTKKLNT